MRGDMFRPKQSSSGHLALQKYCSYFNVFQ